MRVCAHICVLRVAMCTDVAAFDAKMAVRRQQLLAVKAAEDKVLEEGKQKEAEAVSEEVITPVQTRFTLDYCSL